MPVKTEFVTAEYIRSVGLPTHGGRYAVIPHGTLIDESRNNLNAAGFKIKHELYKTTGDGQIAQGIYHLDYGTDNEMTMMFAWSNSYNKSMRFKCAVGAQVIACMNGMVSGDIGQYRRKHTGSARYDAINMIDEQISMGKICYDNLVADKEMLKVINLSSKEQGSILGELVIDQEIITLTQLGIIKRELKAPSFNYNVAPDSAWALYNHITLALKESHPSFYLRDHQTVHSFFVDRFGTLQPTVPSYPVAEVEEFEPITPELELSGFGVNFL